jgi:UDP-glucuronate decarboxylase
VVSNFIVQALQGRPITIYGSGQQTRAFCYVDDLIDGAIGLMKTEVDVTGPLNIGNPAEFTMIELAQMIIRLTNSSSRIEYLPLPQDDPKQRRPDIALARSTLGWEPTIALEDGLKKTIAYFDGVLRAP